MSTSIKQRAGPRWCCANLILRLFTLHGEGRLTACGLPANHPLVRFVQEPGSLDKALDLDDTVLWDSLSMLMDAEDELVCLRARQLSERKLLKCMDIWSEAAVLLTPDKREDSAARSERVARISLTCDRVLERMAEVPGVLADDYKRDPYKRFQDSRTPPNQIHIMQDVEGHLCPPEHKESRRVAE